MSYIEITNPREIQDFLKKNKNKFILEDSFIFEIESEDNEYNIPFIIEVKKEKEYPTEKEFHIYVYEKGKSKNQSILEISFKEKIIYEYSGDTLEKDMSFLPELKKRRIIAQYNDIIYYEENDDSKSPIKTTDYYFDEEEYKAKGYYTTDETKIFSTLEKFNDYLSSLEQDFESFIEPVKSIMKRYGFSSIPKDKIILEKLKERNMRIFLIEETPDSIDDTAPREFIFESFQQYQY